MFPSPPAIDEGENILLATPGGHRQSNQMLKIALSKMDYEVADEVIHRVGVLRPGAEISLVGADLQVILPEGDDTASISQLIHDQFLQCRHASQIAALRADLYARLLK